MQFRPHKPGDAPVIEGLFYSVFTRSEGEQEGVLVSSLAREMMVGTDSRDLYGFVADDNGMIAGAIFFSRLIFKDDPDVFILGPVAVRADQQGMGTGTALITHGLREMGKRGVRFVITYGDPAFYSRLGFQHISQDAIQAPHTLSQTEGWLGQSRADVRIETINGRCTCVKALDNPVYW